MNRSDYFSSTAAPHTLRTHHLYAPADTGRRDITPADIVSAIRRHDAIVTARQCGKTAALHAVRAEQRRRLGLPPIILLDGKTG